MVLHSRLAVPIALAILAACRTTAPTPAIDADFSARVPTATTVLAGIDLDLLRASPVYPKLPPSAQAYLAPFAQAHRVLIAYAGPEILVIARGTIPGATQLTPDLVLSGAPDLITAANEPHPPAALLAPAETVARNPVWIAVRGGVALPLEGNLANVNNLLRPSEFITMTLQLTDPASLDLVAQSPTADAAVRFEQSFRAIVSLAAATRARQPDTAALLQSIKITRDDRLVRVSLSAAMGPLSKLLF